MAQSLADVMFVSTYWGYERNWTHETLLPFAEEMGPPPEMGRDTNRKRNPQCEGP